MRALLLLLILPILSVPARAGTLDHAYSTPAEAADSIRSLGLALRKKSDTRALFPLIYSLTIRATERKLARGEFRNAAWVRTLIVNYANLYRRTIQAELNGKRRSLPLGWQLAFDFSNSQNWNADADVVYGIHVHIARDLVEALFVTPTNFHSPSVKADYLQITEGLRDTMPEIWQVFLSYNAGPRLLPIVEKSVMMNWIAKLREEAWEQAEFASTYDRATQAQTLARIDAKVARRSGRHGALLPLLGF